MSTTGTSSTGGVLKQSKLDITRDGVRGKLAEVIVDTDADIDMVSVTYDALSSKSEFHMNGEQAARLADALLEAAAACGTPIVS